MITFANRASAVLFEFLRSRNFHKPFLLPANVCPVVPLTMMKAGVDYEFVDIDERHTMSEEKALKRLDAGSYSGLLFVHSYGHHFDNRAFYAELRRKTPSLCIIDDRCLCKPEIEDKLPENVDMALYSTGYAKYVELSYGGYGIIRKPTEAETGNPGGGIFEYSKEKESQQQVYIKKCLKEGLQYEWDADYPWLDCSQLKMTPAQYTGIIRTKLAKVEADKEIINAIYRNNLPKEIQWGEGYEDWRFMIRVENRDEVLKSIFEDGLFAGVNFPSVAWMFKGQHCKNAETEASHMINLFNDFRVNERMAYRICEMINKTINEENSYSWGR